LLTTRVSGPPGGFPPGDVGARVEAALVGVLDRALGRVVEEAQANAPVKTGALRRSIRVHEFAHRTSGAVEGTIAAGGQGAPYAPAQEFGSGLSGPSKAKYPIVPVKAKALRWPVAGQGEALRLSGTARSGAPVAYVFATRVMHPGVEPKRYVGRAIETVWPQAEKWATEAVAAVLGGGA
jgi:hypothetical protein